MTLPPRQLAIPAITMSLAAGGLLAASVVAAVMAWQAGLCCVAYCLNKRAAKAHGRSWYVPKG